MLEASDHESFDNFLKFYRALVDSFCGYAKSAEVTKTFTTYVDTVNFVFGRVHETCCNYESLALLCSQMFNFKLIAWENFSNYRPSGLLKQKRHSLKQLRKALKQNWGY